MTLIAAPTQTVRTLCAFPSPVRTHHAFRCSAKPRCRCCGAAGELRRRGLCRRCWNDKSVRKRYSRDQRNAPGRDPKEEDLATPEPTLFRPGTVRKQHLMVKRLRNGQKARHPLDADMLDEEDKWRSFEENRDADS